MQFEIFCDVMTRAFNSYFMKVNDMDSKGEIHHEGYKILYPTMLILTKCDGYHVAELLGSTQKISQLKVKKSKEKSVLSYFYQFDAPALEAESMVRFEGAGNKVSNILFTRSDSTDAVKERFPYLGTYKTELQINYGVGAPFSFGPNFESLSIQKCAIVNNYGNIYRCKDVLAAFVFKSNITLEKFTKTLNSFLSGEANQYVRFVNKENEEIIYIAGQLQNMYFFPKLHETTIGEFLKQHPKVVMRAFNSRHVEYEPYFEWIERSESCEDKAINPDLLVQRADGFYDIYDLKKALLTKNSITSGPRKRRQFIHSVSDGIAQLANYEEYFTYSKNAAHAKTKYNIEVNKPKLTLVVGNWDNTHQDEISQALRAYKNNIEIIDYDTFCNMFIQNN